MNYLALDTAGETIAVVLRAGEKLYSYFCREPRRASELLLPEADKLLDSAGLGLSDMDFFACTVGPGSFTGIRIGLTVAKSFCYAFGKKLAAVNSMRRLAYDSMGSDVVCVSYAYADNYFLAAYSADGRTVLPPECVGINELPARVNALPGAVITDEKGAAALGRGRIFDPTASLARITDDIIARGECVPFETVEPEYLLESQAERTLRERGAAVTVSRAGEADSGAIAAIERERIECPWSEADLRLALGSADYTFFKAESDGAIAGYVGVRPIGDEAEIQNIAVRAELVRRGIGRKLMQAAEEAAKKSGAKRLYLEVAEDNAPARALYTSLGYTVAYTRPRYYGNRAALVMKKELF